MSAFILFMNDLKSFFYFFILDNHSLVVDTPLSFSLLPLRSHLQCFLYYLLWTTESVLGYPVFDGDGRILAGWFPNMCSGCYAQVRQFLNSFKLPNWANSGRFDRKKYNTGLLCRCRLCFVFTYSLSFKHTLLHFAIFSNAFASFLTSIVVVKHHCK